jgi:hypothetical protein
VTTTLAKLHQATVHHDTCDPSLEAGISAKAVKVLEGRGIRYLNRIL